MRKFSLPAEQLLTFLVRALWNYLTLYAVSYVKHVVQGCIQKFPD